MGEPTTQHAPLEDHSNSSQTSTASKRHPSMWCPNGNHFFKSKWNNSTVLNSRYSCRSSQNCFWNSCVCSHRCDGRKSCSVPAVNSVFSDPCVGTHKYLDVSYLCLPFSKSIFVTHYHSKIGVGKIFLKDVSFAHQGCIYFVTLKLLYCEMLQFKMTVFCLF